jgi:hypothetical protein
MVREGGFMVREDGFKHTDGVDSSTYRGWIQAHMGGGFMVREGGFKHI